MSRLILSLIAATAVCTACTYFYPSVPTGPNFEVEVKNTGRPVPGLRLELRGGATRTVVETNKNGLAQFHSIPPGPYQLTADHDAGMASGTMVEVKPHGPPNVTLHLTWPGATTIRVRSLQGTLHGPGYQPGQPQPGFQLDLLDALSERLLKTVHTGDNGEFVIADVAPGLYFLSLKPSNLTGGPGESITGSIVVAVDPAATTDHLETDLGWTSCGLWYADRNQCPQQQPDLNLTQLSGQVMDIAGAPISGATILLLKDGQTPVEQLKSDTSGKFESTHILAAGFYELVIRSAGFTPLKRTVHAESTSHHPFITVHLGVADTCSAAEIH
ncbi:MAG TPA: carboxypeptidase-like regulatory domain-containing protein [Bryobacteraceae bacterium]